MEKTLKWLEVGSRKQAVLKGLELGIVSLEEATAGLNIETLATLTNKEVEVLKTSVANQGMYITRSQIAQQSGMADRKSTRLNSSHQIISYAVFCLKKKKIKQYTR